MGQEAQVAVFIDFDNIEISVEETFGRSADVDWNRIFQTAGQNGRVVLRRAYADWAESAAKQRALLAMGVELVHVNSKRGKNAADIRIVIDALELFHSDPDSFSHLVLVSGDGDFTELVHRLRAHGKVVTGIGLSSTSAEFLVNACDNFIYYDKLQGVSKVKKPVLAPMPQAGSAPAPRANGKALATTPEGKLEQYSSILAARKLRVGNGQHRPAVIYKIYEMVRTEPEALTFNQLKERLEAHYAAQEPPQVEPQAAVDIAYQLFYTFCFEFDPDSHERILNRPMSFSADVQKAADLLEKSDRKLLQMLLNELGSADRMDPEVAAVILYGGVRTPKVLEHIAGLVSAE